MVVGEEVEALDAGLPLAAIAGRIAPT